MIAVARDIRSYPASFLKLGGAVAAAGALVASVVLLAVALRSDPAPSLDRTVMDWVAGWNAPGLAGFFTGISLVTQLWPAMALGVLALAFLLLLGKKRQAMALALAGGGVGLAAFSVTWRWRRSSSDRGPSQACRKCRASPAATCSAAPCSSGSSRSWRPAWD